MQFDKPKTKEQMFTILNQIFHYYRVVFAEYEQTPLKELELTRLEYTPSTDAEIKQKASRLLGDEAKQAYDKKHQEISAEIDALNKLCSERQKIAEQAVQKLNNAYAESEEKIRIQAQKNGVVHTSAYLDKIALLESEKNAKIVDISEQANMDIANYDAQIFKLTNALTEHEKTNGVVSQTAIDAKVVKLKEEEQEIVREVFKYNNGLDEKEQRYKNDIIRQKATIKMRYLEIRAQELTHDQLVDMGYYDDALDCVCAYYDTLAPATAFNQVQEDVKLMIYLDDLYQNLLYMYGIRSGLIG